MLKKCLSSILKEITRSNHGDFIVIIENDSESRSQDVVKKLQKQFPDIPMYYQLEPNMGIPFARQTGLNFALTKAPSWMAFIDDDEELEEGWLDAMRRASDEMDCEVLTGPVRYMYPDTIPCLLYTSPSPRDS